MRVAHIVTFLILKILAYDIVYCLEHFGDGPVDVADRFIDFDRHWPGESLLLKAIDILNRRFASDPAIQGAQKDGPTSFARFLTDPGRPDHNAQRRQNATAVVELFLRRFAAAKNAPRSNA